MCVVSRQRLRATRTGRVPARRSAASTQRWRLQFIGERTRQRRELQASQFRPVSGTGCTRVASEKGDDRPHSWEDGSSVENIVVAHDLALPAVGNHHQDAEALGSCRSPGPARINR
jgi:hypothetical protein